MTFLTTFSTTLKEERLQIMSTKLLEEIIVLKSNVLESNKIVKIFIRQSSERKPDAFRHKLDWFGSLKFLFEF